MVEGVVKRRCASGAPEPKSRVSVVDSYLPTGNIDETSEYNRSSSCHAPPLCRSLLFGNKVCRAAFLVFVKFYLKAFFGQRKEESAVNRDSKPLHEYGVQSLLRV